jgi:hypothetical protein
VLLGGLDGVPHGRASSSSRVVRSHQYDDRQLPDLTESAELSQSSGRRVGCAPTAHRVPRLD